MGSNSSHTLAGKICLLLSYHLRSTTFVTLGSSLAPSRLVSKGATAPLLLECLGRASGLKFARSGDAEREVLVEWVFEIGRVVVEV